MIFSYWQPYETDKKEFDFPRLNLSFGPLLTNFDSKKIFLKIFQVLSFSSLLQAVALFESSEWWNRNFQRLSKFPSKFSPPFLTWVFYLDVLWENVEVFLFWIWYWLQMTGLFALVHQGTPLSLDQMLGNFQNHQRKIFHRFLSSQICFCWGESQK